MPYDTSAIDRDGARRRKLRKELTQVEARLKEAIPPAREAGVTEAYVMTATGYAGSMIQKLVKRARAEEAS
jgi:hypothetical protein